MSEFFKYFGIAICVILVDAVVSLWIIIVSEKSEKTEEDEGLIGALIVNALAFAVVTAILIGERMG